MQVADPAVIAGPTASAPLSARPPALRRHLWLPIHCRRLWTSLLLGRDRHPADCSHIRMGSNPAPPLVPPFQLTISTSLRSSAPMAVFNHRCGPTLRSNACQSRRFPFSRQPG